MRQQNLQEAIIELGAIENDYGGSIAARAQFNLANAHYESRNYDEAIANFQEYIDKYHSDKFTTSSAIAGIAACMENKQDFQDAGDKYTEAIEYYPEGASAPDYYLGAVRCYVLAGDSERASQIHADMKEKYPANEYYRIATRLLMGTKIN
jgi:TolA-binding protein